MPFLVPPTVFAKAARSLRVRVYLGASVVILVVVILVCSEVSDGYGD